MFHQECDVLNRRSQRVWILGIAQIAIQRSLSAIYYEPAEQTLHMADACVIFFK